MMHKRNIWVGAVVGSLIGFFGPVASAQADTIYSNFGAGYSYGAFGWTIGAPVGLGVSFSPRMQFTSGGNYDLTQIDLALGYSSGTNAVTVSLYTDSGGSLGNLLGSWNLSSLANFSGGSSVQTISGIANISLVSAAYWLQVTPSGDFLGGWNKNNTGATGPKCSDPLPCETDILGAFDVIGTAETPIPGALPLFATGLGVGLMTWRRKRKANRC